jgi:hypothetical protein
VTDIGNASETGRALWSDKADYQLAVSTWDENMWVLILDSRQLLSNRAGLRVASGQAAQVAAVAFLEASGMFVGHVRMSITFLYPL